jgi:CNT family concentrative nucleoside transporter
MRSRLLPAALVAALVAPVAHAAEPVQAVFRPYDVTVTDRVRSAVGVIILVGLCVLLSRNRRAIDWRLVGIGLMLQGAFAVLVLWTRPGEIAFQAANDSIVGLLGYGEQGSAFLFRSFVSGQIEPANINFAFKILPSILFFSSLMAVLYHIGLMGAVIRALSVVMQRTMGTSGAETLSTAANIFVGQTEAPLLVRPFVASFTRSELLVVMAGGMANTAGGVLAAYVGMLSGAWPGIAGHLLAQSIMSAPAALVTAKILWPEDGVPVTQGRTHIEVPRVDANVVEAAARGASEGMQLALNVAAMLVAFLALVALLDGAVAWTTVHLGLGPVTFQQIVGFAMVPMAAVMGVPWADCPEVGALLGTKVVLNEFVAYGQLSSGLTDGSLQISDRAMLITSYALAGFANFGSIGIQIGGIGALAPERRGDIAALGFLALVAGSFATFMTACIAGVLG